MICWGDRGRPHARGRGEIRWSLAGELTRKQPASTLSKIKNESLGIEDDLRGLFPGPYLVIKSAGLHPLYGDQTCASLGPPRKGCPCPWSDRVGEGGVLAPDRYLVLVGSGGRDPWRPLVPDCYLVLVGLGGRPHFAGRHRQIAGTSLSPVLLPGAEKRKNGRRWAADDRPRPWRSEPGPGTVKTPRDWTISSQVRVQGSRPGTTPPSGGGASLACGPGGTLAGIHSEEGQWGIRPRMQFTE